MRKADYGPSYGGLKFLVEAKPIGDDLWKKDGAVNQVKELFLLHERGRLIDQIVYRLYGLTDEEIRVVEGGDEKRNSNSKF
jgi:hypothetical protein